MLQKTLLNGLMSFVFVITSLMGTVAAAPPPPDGLVLPAEEFVPDSPAVGMTVQRSDVLGALTFLAAAPGKSLQQPVPLPVGASPEAAARAFLNEYGGQFNLQDVSSELSVVREAAGEKGASMVRFQQFQNGLPVLGGELIVNLDAAKNVLSVNGEIVPAGGYDPIPQVDSDAALATALEATARKYNLPAEKLAVNQPALWVYNPIVFSQNNSFKNSLVWRMEVKATNNAPLREFVLVGAEKGDIALSFNQVDTLKSREVYTMNGSEDDGELPGTLLCSEGNTGGCVSDTEAINAYDFSGYAYDYYKTQFDRDSIDNAGMKMLSSIHFGAQYENAFWNGRQMTFGDGFASALDVVAHEMSHGVTDYTSALYYWMESGAINEAYSDIHGEFTELLYNPGSPDDRWYVSEDLPASIGPFRYMKDPTQFGDPDKLSSPNYFNNTADNGGVHMNSGIVNKAAYLMVDGDTFNGFTVKGIGLEKTAAVFYYSQSHYLTSAANFTDLYLALQQSCQVLASAGSKGITQADCGQVKNASEAVELNAPPEQRAIDDAKFTYSATGWSSYSSSHYYFKTLHVSNKRKSSADLSFIGSRIVIYYMTGPKYGKLDVYLDNKQVATINQNTRRSGYTCYYLSSLAFGPHVLTLKHASGKLVNVDAVVTRAQIHALDRNSDIMGDNLRMVDYKGLWEPDIITSSVKTGDFAAYYFYGSYANILFFGARGFGNMQIKIDNITYKIVKQGNYSGKFKIWQNSKPLPNTLHKVIIKHTSGGSINFITIGGRDNKELGSGDRNPNGTSLILGEPVE
jgi:Zn-dependent metalloprotease